MAVGMRAVDNRLGWPEIAEAAAALGAAAVAVRLAPFRKIAAMLAQPAGCGRESAAEVDRVRRALDAWTRRLPFPPKCFARGLAATWMLRRRGIRSTLHYGAATIDGKLRAHVWVRSGAFDVVGCDIAGDYAVLATFPDS
jgi:hypothetical protein